MCEQSECGKVQAMAIFGSFWLLYISKFSLYAVKLIMPWCACTKVITVVGQCVYMCICVPVYLYVCNSHFSKVAKNQALANAVQAQCDNIS